MSKDNFKKTVELPKNLSELPPVLTVKQIAKILNLHKNGAYQLMKKEGFPSIFLGKKIIVPRDSFLQWMKNEASKSVGEKIAQ